VRLTLAFVPVFILTLAGACGGTVNGKIGRGASDGGVDDASPGEGGCLDETPTQGSPCTLEQVLCHPGNECCNGRWSCDPMTLHSGLVRANCACLAGLLDGSHAAGDSSMSTGDFACGPSDSCNAATQYCHIVNGHLGGMKPTYGCETVDGGGSPSCQGATAKAPGECGCYESASGEVTITDCPP